MYVYVTKDINVHYVSYSLVDIYIYIYIYIELTQERKKLNSLGVNIHT